MIRRILRLFRRYPSRPNAEWIARRAVRVGNRCPERAGAYERVHTILARGK